MPTFGIAGAGLLGRLLAWQLARAGHRVAVYDAAPGREPLFDAQGPAAFSAAGMLSPLAERDHAAPAVAALGWRSIALWQGIVAALGSPGPFFAQRGSLLLAHRADGGTAQRVLARLHDAIATPQPLDAAALQALEPALPAFAHAWLLPGEAQIDPLATLAALHAQARGVQWHWGRPVARVAPGRLQFADGSAADFDTAIDVRGLGARDALPLRGVRGETAWLHAPGHGLARPVRLLHARHRVYLVPRPGDLMFVGATEIESEDCSNVSLKSAVELMSAAHSVLPMLAEARILRLDRHLRPALPDHLPRLEHADGLLRINGLFRHGWLMAPALVEDAMGVLAHKVAA
ncbi:FAD-dependent oxidoreductase [Pseudorhodoferax sp. Leaf267]|uniref:FAD-dependent oxidoreductase n=1 Tax=Pseudorhodoferax sp. Leaf267 TaxID=1736316 RepID=UPI0006F6C180|nr:FAD-dependent oxidoreductase [Pseudorhodoferax sp. Leaf267]KQP20038.1 thiamine biosynthesis protein thio [Pseudorhodoferax sp. Leaf267]